MWSRPSVDQDLIFVRRSTHFLLPLFFITYQFVLRFSADWLSPEIFIGLHLYYGMLDALINNAAFARIVAQCNKRIRESGKKIRINLVGILV